MAQDARKTVVQADTEQENEATRSEVPDVASIMAGIRARVRSDVQAHKDSRRPFAPTGVDIEAGTSKKASDLVHSEELRYLNRNYAHSARLNVAAISSHRPGIIGKALVKAKRKLLQVLWDSLLKEYLANEREFQGNLVRFLNDLTTYVGARDASMFWELVRKIDVDVGKALERIERIADEHSAALRSSERHLIESLDAQMKDLRGWLQQVHTLAAQHEDKLTTLESVARGLESIVARLSQSAHPSISAPATPTVPLPEGSGDASYLLLENRFRGGEHEIARRLAIYPPLFHGATLPVLEIGCGRGELQQLFKDAGVPSLAVDTDPQMVAAAREKGFAVQHGDGLAFLEQQADESLGGVIAVQVVEHLTQDQLQRLFRACARKVAPGGTIVFETINPRSVLALSSNYFRDPTHVWPLHPDTLGFAMNLCGLEVRETRFLSPVAAEAQLQPVPVDEYLTPRWVQLIETINRNISQLNELLYGTQDYCIIATVRGRGVQGQADRGR